MKPTRITERFATLRREGKKAFVAYITAGDPDGEATEDIVLRLEDQGADIIELGIPFSDPLADGAANQRAAERALAAGTRYSQILSCVRRIRERSEIPLMLYSYMNPLVARGFEKCVSQAARAGVDGTLLVDLSMEEVAPYHEILQAQGVDYVPLVTPTTPNERLKKIVQRAGGFVYAVSRVGVTGEQSQLQDEASSLLRRTHRYTQMPVALGFGVSTPEQARDYAKMTEAVVVGSYIVNAFHQAGTSPRGRSKAARDVGRLIQAVKSV